MKTIRYLVEINLPDEENYPKEFVANDIECGILGDDKKRKWLVEVRELIDPSKEYIGQ